LDEIDKVSKSQHSGDPSSALLEVLDPNQNNSFVDHYLGVPFDLSNVLFIGTANTLDEMQPALLDRLEIISLHGYTQQEKTAIAQNFLIPKQIEENGLEKWHVIFPKPSVEYIVKYYTKEAGVRNLERIVASLCRKVAFDYLKTTNSQDKDKDKDQSQGQGQGQSKETDEQTRPKAPAITITKDLIHATLGPKFYDEDITERLNQPGIALGLAWTSVGGKILLVEGSKSIGKGKLEITGHLGDVMKESVRTALSWIKANMEYLMLSFGQMGDLKKNSKYLEVADQIKAEHIFDTIDLHIHFPAAAIPKDGPSAGITIAMALISLLTGRKVRSDIAMTGEISLKGQVLPVGGIKEKCLAAYEAGVKNIILPERNKKDIEEISKEIRDNMNFYFVKHITDVINLAIEKDAHSPDLTALHNIHIKDINKLSKL